MIAQRRNARSVGRGVPFGGQAVYPETSLQLSKVGVDPIVLLARRPFDEGTTHGIDSLAVGIRGSGNRVPFKGRFVASVVKCVMIESKADVLDNIFFVGFFGLVLSAIG